MTQNPPKIQLVGFEADLRKDVGCMLSLATAHDPTTGDYWKYSNLEMKLRRPVHCFDRAATEKLQSDGWVTLLPEAEYIEIDEGQPILALRADKKFLSVVGLDSPPDSFWGTAIKWKKYDHEDNPRYVAFLPEEQAKALSESWAEHSLDKALAITRKAKADGQPVPHKALEPLVDAGCITAISAPLRYKFHLFALAKLFDAKVTDPKDPYYKFYKDITMRGERPDMDGNRIDGDVQSLLNTHCTEFIPAAAADRVITITPSSVMPVIE